MRLHLALALPLLVAAHHGHSNHHEQLVRRAREASTTTAVVAAASSSSTQLTATTTTTTAEATSPLPTTYAPGATPVNIPGAPVLPDASQIVIADYPALDIVPPINSTEMIEWMTQIDMANIPDIPPTGLGGCANTTYNAAAIANASASGNCWWTCGHCTRDSDITFCPTKGTWGISFDDGPSPDTPRLLDYLEAKNILATFFVVGSRAISRPQMLQTAYMMGHQISVHTWAHSSLTTLSNEEIIAELAWSKAIIKAVTGVTPNTMRPPYGDIDDRVRYICKQMGLTPIIWTVQGTTAFDTQDWQIDDMGISVSTVLQNWANIIGNSTSMPTGFIVLEHDLESIDVDIAIDTIIPSALNFSTPLTMQPIITCLGQPLHQAYMETFVSTSSNSSSGSGATTLVTTDSNGQTVTLTSSGTTKTGRATRAAVGELVAAATMALALLLA